jgi:undecaprenyl diphosphate synthase
VKFGKGLIKINFLVNYGWNWDLAHSTNKISNTTNLADSLASKDISRIDLVVRWGGRCRLSGFLPIQSVYADFYVINDMWPDFKPDQFHKALDWYQTQDVTLGG